jgi:hypothetical protein
VRRAIWLLTIVVSALSSQVRAETADDAGTLVALRGLYGAAPTRRNAEAFQAALDEIANRLPEQDAAAVAKQAIAWLELVFDAEPDYARDGQNCSNSDAPACITLGALYRAVEQAYATIGLSVRQRGALEPFHRFARRLHRVSEQPCEAHLSDEQRAVRALVLAKYLFRRVYAPVVVHDTRCLRVTTLGGKVEFTDRADSRFSFAIDIARPSEIPEPHPTWPMASTAPSMLLHIDGVSWGETDVLQRVRGEWRFVTTRSTSISCSVGNFPLP